MGSKCFDRNIGNSEIPPSSGRGKILGLFGKIAFLLFLIKRVGSRYSKRIDFIIAHAQQDSIFQWEESVVPISTFKSCIGIVSGRSLMYWLVQFQKKVVTNRMEGDDLLIRYQNNTRLVSRRIEMLVTRNNNKQQQNPLVW